QGGLADAGARKDAEPLPVADGDERVERAHSEVEPPVDAGALERGGRRRGDRPQLAVGLACAVERPAEPVEHPAEERSAAPNAERAPGRGDRRARADPPPRP